MAFLISYLCSCETFACIAGSGDNSDKDAYKTQSLEPYRKAFSGPVIAAGGYIKTTAEEELTDGVADLVAFGIQFNLYEHHCIKRDLVTLYRVLCV